MFQRFRRLKKTPILREMITDVRFSLDSLIMPYFVVEGENIKTPITSMTGQFQFSIDMLIIEIRELLSLGIRSVLLFGIPTHKDIQGSSAWDDNGIIQRAIIRLKQEFPDLFIIADLCLCEYTSTGHCGVLKQDNVDNDATLSLLSKVALSYAQSGVDMIAPSDMMDGRIQELRRALDKADYYDLPIMSYSSKYASAYYGPFRQAADSAPQSGDRKGYQMDFRRKNECLDKAYADINEGADIIMVKPALAYLDIVQKLSQHINVPIAVYNVSGEYAMIKSVASQGLISEKAIVMENMHAFVRAGAQIIITYHAKDIAQWSYDE